MEKPKKVWQFRESLHEENVSGLFWEAIEAIKEGKELPKDFPEVVHLTPHIVVSAVKKGRPIPSKMSKATLCYQALKLYSKVECWDCIKNMLREIGDSPACSVAFERFLAEGNEQSVKTMFSKFPEELLKAFEELSKERIEPYFDFIYKIAKNEIGEKQYLALLMLYSFLDKEDVVSLFKTFAQDWDPKVRRISINALLKTGEDFSEFAKRLMRDEDDPVNISLLKRLIK